MTDEKRNLPASIAARLLDVAKQTGDDYQTLFASFCFERFLHRLGASSVRDRFVLKGAMLLRLWTDRPYRATRDLDLLRRGDGSFAAIREDIRMICATPVEPDGVAFDTDAIRIEAIRAEDEHAGTRATLPASCGSPTFRRPTCSPIRARRSLRRSSRRWSSSVIATAGSRTFSICTI